MSTEARQQFEAEEKRLRRWAYVLVPLALIGYFAYGYFYQASALSGLYSPATELYVSASVLGHGLALLLFMVTIDAMLTMFDMKRSTMVAPRVSRFMLVVMPALPSSGALVLGTEWLRQWIRAHQAQIYDALISVAGWNLARPISALAPLGTLILLVFLIFGCLSIHFWLTRSYRRRTEPAAAS